MNRPSRSTIIASSFLLALTLNLCAAWAQPQTVTLYAESVREGSGTNNWFREIQAQFADNSNCNGDSRDAYNGQDGDLLIVDRFEPFTLPAGRVITGVFANVKCRYDINTNNARVVMRVYGSRNIAEETDTPSWNQGSSTSCAWRFTGDGWNITSFISGWNQADINALRAFIARDGAYSGSTLRVDAFRLRVRHEADFDGDRSPDTVDTDDDGDLVEDGLDCAPLNATAWQNQAFPDDDRDGVRNTVVMTTCPCFGFTVPIGFTLNVNGPDNCGSVPNSDQRNYDRDSLGDVCDPDDDNDGVLDGIDNCEYYNPGQEDTDGDGIGDGCDNCPLISNAAQSDSDYDWVGDACDCAPSNDQLWRNQALLDSDLDTIPDSLILVHVHCYGEVPPYGFCDPFNQIARDNCVSYYNPAQEDRDYDAIGDECDLCPDVWDPVQMDSDSDGWPDACDNCSRFNPDQSDQDADGMGDECDRFKIVDVTGDGRTNGPNNFVNIGSVQVNGTVFTVQSGGGLLGRWAASSDIVADISDYTLVFNVSASAQASPLDDVVDTAVELIATVDAYRSVRVTGDLSRVSPRPDAYGLIGPGQYSVAASASLRVESGESSNSSDNFWISFSNSTSHPCIGDFNEDGGIDGLDVIEFFTAWESGSIWADVNEDGGVNGEDVATFFDRWEAGAC